MAAGEFRRDLPHQALAGVQRPVRPGAFRRGTAGVGFLRVEDDQVAGADHVPVAAVNGRGQARLGYGDEELIVPVRAEGELAERRLEQLQAAEILGPPDPGGSGGLAHQVSVTGAISSKTRAGVLACRAGKNRSSRRNSTVKTHVSEPLCAQDPDRVLGRTAEIAVGWLRSLDRRPVRESATVGELRSRLGGPLPERSADPLAVVEDLSRAVEP